MEGWTLLRDVLLLLGGATVLGGVCERLKQSAIVGYLISGMVLGPSVLGLISGESEIDVLAELGVALLLFTIGLEFSWRRLRGLGVRPLIGGILQVTLTLLFVAMVARLFGMSTKASLVIGAVIAPSSTAVVLRMLFSKARLETAYGRLALAVLLLQDIAVVPLVLFVETLGSDGTPGEVLTQLGITLISAIGLVIGFILLFNYIVPWMLGRRLAQRNRELPILLAIVTALGSTWVAHELKVSPALGAFVAGMLLASSPFATQIRADVSGLRTLLVTLFFASVGMFADPSWMAANLGWLVFIVVFIIVGKAAIIWGIFRALGQSTAYALATGWCLAQVGEFSFVLATIGYEKALLTDWVFQLLVSATIVTLIATPYQVTTASWVQQRLIRLRRHIQGADADARDDPDESEEETERPLRIIIIGFGPAGQAVARSLREQNVHTTAVDLNPNVKLTASTLCADWEIGDAAHPDVLKHVHVDSADAVVITLPDAETNARVIRMVRSFRTELPLVVRSRYHMSAEMLDIAGADVVVDEEHEVGKRLAREVQQVVDQAGLPAQSDDD